MKERRRRRSAPEPGPEPDDPLRTLLEALAAQADLLRRYAEQIHDEAFIGTARRHDREYVAATDEDGSTRVEFGDGVHGRRPPDASPAQAFGIHRALVVTSVDPLAQGRLQVQVPGIVGEPGAWALPCFPSPNRELPAAGDVVWVLFEAGDTHRPVWLGSMD